MAAAALQEGNDEGKSTVAGAIVFCFEHARYGVLDEGSSEGMGAVGRGEVNVEVGGEGLLLNSGEDRAGALQDGDANGKKSIRHERFQWW